MSNNKKNTAARNLFIGARVFSLQSTKLDENYNHKAKELRIEVPVTLYTTKTILVNEVKGIKGLGNVDIIVVNGDSNKLNIPANYEFVESASAFKAESHSESNPAFFSDYDAVLDIANTNNQGELIRMKAIRVSIDEAIKAIEDVMAANKSVAPLYKEEND